MGKTSLANTFAEFLKSPTEPMPVLTKGTVLEFTKVMQLYDGLNINQKKDVVVKVEELPRNESVKLVKLKMGNEDDETSDNWITDNETTDNESSDGETPNAESPLRSEKDNKNDVQLKLVDMGGHSATMVLTI